jgi:hypothetical protein
MYVEDHKILDATDGGLQIILHYYPNAHKVIHKAARTFKIRESEKTASASLKQLQNGIWVVTDFGGDQKSRNGIQVCALEEGITYHEACVMLGSRYQVEGAKLQVYMPVIEKRALKSTESKGEYYFEYNESISEKELKLLGPRVNQVHCTTVKLKSCKSFTYCKDNEAIVTTSTEDYPILVFDFGEWQKIYQPNSFEKQYRFRYAGKKPSRHMWGLDAIKKAYQKNVKKQEQEGYDDFEDYEPGEEPTKKKKKYDPRLDRIFIVSGGSDGINLLSFEEYPIWFNSESEHLEFSEYRELKTYAKEIIYIADLDVTGKKQAIAQGLKYLDIKIMWLPEKLKMYRDKRGNPRKDFKDYVEVFYHEETSNNFKAGFNRLASNALPLQFWTETYKASGNEVKVSYNVSNTRLYHFLANVGFGRYESENLKDGFFYVKKEGSIVKVVEPYQIENFVHDFLEERGMPTELRDFVYRSPQLSERSLQKLPKITVDFTIADAKTQYWFFPKRVWKITADEILDFKQGEVDKYIWEDKVIDFDPKLEGPHFKISKDESGNHDIQILESNNWFLNYLINTSRVHWRKELEDYFEDKTDTEAEAYFQKYHFAIDGPNLSEDEIYEQKRHLINKIYSIGYLVHQYKNYNKPWAIFAMDNKISDLGESHGGTGKSLCYSFLNKILKRRVYLKGRDPKLTQNDFIYHEVTEDTDYVLIDDATQYLNFDFFFSEITGSLKVNPKNGSPFEIPFEKSPKFCFTSNFAMRNMDPSTSRRLLLSVFSDYYHSNDDDEYKQVRKVSDDFGGKNLFTDFDYNQYNKYYNFISQCVQYFLSEEEKMNPPMDNVTKRNLKAEMGDMFEGWAEAFFSTIFSPDEGSGFKYLNQFVSKEMAFEEFCKATAQKKWSQAKFKKALKAFCQYNNYVFNPKEYHNSGGRIIKSIDGKSQEVFYIDTTPADKINKVITDFEVISDDEKTIFD